MVVCDDESLFYQRMAYDFKFDGVRAYVFSGTRLEEFLDAACKVEVSVFVEIALVTGAVETIVCKNLSVQVGTVAISFKDAFAADLNFVAFSDSHVEMGKGLPDGTGLYCLFAIRGNDRRAFRHAVAFENGEAYVQKESQDGFVQGTAARNNHAEISADRFSHFFINE